MIQLFGPFRWMYRDAEEALNIIDETCVHAALERMLLKGKTVNVRKPNYIQ